jgi:hypothetical protein
MARLFTSDYHLLCRGSHFTAPSNLYGLSWMWDTGMTTVLIMVGTSFHQRVLLCKLSISSSINIAIRCCRNREKHVIWFSSLPSRFSLFRTTVLKQPTSHALEVEVIKQRSNVPSETTLAIIFTAAACRSHVMRVCTHISDG